MALIIPRPIVEVCPKCKKSRLGVDPDQNAEGPINWHYAQWHEDCNEGCDPKLIFDGGVQIHYKVAQNG